MLKVNLDTEINNILYLEYMKQKEEEFNAEQKELQEKERTWKVPKTK